MEEMLEDNFNRLMNQAKAADESGNIPEAEQILRTGMELAEQASDTRNTALFLNSLASIYWRRGDLENAVESYKRAFDLFENLGDWDRMARCLGSLGTLTGDLNLKIDYFEKAADYFQRADKPRGLALALVMLADAYEGLQQLERSRLYNHRAIELYKHSGDSAQAGNLLHLSAMQDLRDNRVEEAYSGLQEALSLYKSVGDTEQIAKVYYGIGLCYDRQHDLARTLEYYQLSWEIYATVENPKMQARLCSAIGRLYLNQGIYAKAFEYVHNALEYSTKAEEEVNIAMNVALLGRIFSAQRQYVEALACHRHAAQSYKTLGLEGDYAWQLTSMSGCLKWLGEYEEALAYMEEALEIFYRREDTYHATMTLMNMAAIHFRARKFEEALAMRQKAMPLLERGMDQQLVANNLLGLSMIAVGLHRLEEAVAYCNQALAIQEKIGAYSSIPGTLMQLGITCKIRGQWEEASAAFHSALDAYETMGLQVGDPSYVGDFQDAHYGNKYNYYAAFLIGRDLPEEALAIVERGRAQGLARQVAQNHVDLYQLLTPADATQLHNCLEELKMAAYERNTDFVETSKKMQSFDQTNERYRSAERQLQILRADLNARYPDFRRLRGAETPSFSDLSALADANPDTLYLEWAIVDEETTLLFALSAKEGLKTFVLPYGETDLNKNISAWRGSLEARGDKDPATHKESLHLAASEPKLARTLYGMLFPAIEGDNVFCVQNYSRLVIAPDGLMMEIPFAALKDSDGKRLIDRFAISTCISLGVLRWPSHTNRAKNSLLCVAAPDDGHPIMRRGIKFPALQHLSSLIRQLGKLIPGTRILEGREALETVVKQLLPSYAILHFLTHGWLDEENTMRSGLVVAQGEGNLEDGFLEAREILNSLLSAEMAVLSACQSGLGRRSGGEGLLGLAWAFRAANCPSIVASLWRVDDQATVEMMIAFYKALKSGRRKDEALQSAIQELRADDVEKETEIGLHAYFWSGFQIIGNAESLNLYEVGAE